jgi:hypothetical protein
VEVADVDALALIGGLFIESVPAAATYAAHDILCLCLFAEIIRQVYMRASLLPTNMPYLRGF